ncbi:hypothetical protein BGZ65_005856, partial [Modicella reniformis]
MTSSSSTTSSSSQSKFARMGSFLAVAGVAGLAVLGSSLAVTFGNAVDSPGSIIQGGLTSVVPKP